MLLNLPPLAGIYPIKIKPTETMTSAVSLTTVNQLNLLRWLAAALNFPDYFGFSLDAAWDCLSELPTPETGSYKLLINLKNATQLNLDELTEFLFFISEAHEEWDLIELYYIH